MYDLPQNSIKLYDVSYLKETFDIYNSPASLLETAVKKTLKKCNVPENDALNFYFLNHFHHAVSQKFDGLQALPKDIYEALEYSQIKLNEIAQRVFLHVVLVSMDDSRFCSPGAKFLDMLKMKFGDDAVKFAKNDYKGKNSQDISFASSGLSCGEVVNCFYHNFAFNGVSWGKPWTKISGLALEFLRGEKNLSVLTDQAFSLVHNGGSIFNKGRYYQVNSDFLFTILDIQDSGQIPQWIGSNLGNKYIDEKLKKIYQVGSNYFAEFNDGVDQKTIKDSKSKREVAIRLQQKGWQNFAGNMAGQQVQKTKKEAPVAKIDDMIVGDFSRNKWI